MNKTMNKKTNAFTIVELPTPPRLRRTGLIKYAFTIVELLVVIVVIGILATLTIIAYVGIQQRATVTSLKSDLVNSSQSLKLYQVEHSAYPTAINDCHSPAEGNMCLKYSPNNTYPVFESINTNPQTFCLTAESANNTRYHITEDSVPEVGSCSFPFAGSLSAAATSPFSINLAWDTVTGATSYILQQDTTLAFTSATTIATITPPTATTFTSDNLLPNTPYFYRVNVTIDGNTSEWSTYATDTTDQLDVPTAPVVTATTVTDTTTWSWPDVTASCASGTTARYQYRYTIEPAGYDSDWTEPNDPAALSIGFTTSAEGYTYNLEVQAQCYLGDGASSWSTSNAGSSDDYYRPMTTPALTATTVSSTAIDLSWTPITGATSYTLQQATNSSFTSDLTTLATITPPDDTIFSSTGLSSGITYYYRVNKTSAGGTSDWSATESATTTVDAPSAPTVTANTIAGTTTWSWTTPSCVAGTTARYQYRYTIAPSGYDSNWVATASSPVAFTTSTEGQTYTVQIQAQCYNTNTTSTWSTSGQDSYYRIITYTLTISAGTGGTVNTAVNGTYNTGSTPTITATANSYYTFASWSGSTGCSGVTSHTITMNANKTCTASFVLDSNWLAVGTQVWAKANLNVGTRIAGVTNQTNNAILEKYCYSDTESNCTTYGGLYQWNEAMQYVTTQGAQGICPTGSHVPSDNDWKILEMQLGMTQANADATGWSRGTDQGTQLQPGGSSGLNIPLAGYRATDGTLLNLSAATYLWSSSESSTSAWIRRLNSGTATVYRSTYDKGGGYSVRCVRN